MWIALEWAYPSFKLSKNFPYFMAIILFSRTNPFLKVSRNLYTGSNCFIWVPHVPKYFPWFKRHYQDFSRFFLNWKVIIYPKKPKTNDYLDFLVRNRDELVLRVFLPTCVTMTLMSWSLTNWNWIRPSKTAPI